MSELPYLPSGNSPVSPVGPPPPSKSPTYHSAPFIESKGPPKPMGRMSTATIVTIPIVDATDLPPRSVSLSGHARPSSHPSQSRPPLTSYPSADGTGASGKGKSRARAPPLHLDPQALRATAPSSLSPLQQFSSQRSPPHSADSSSSTADDLSAVFSSVRKRMEQSDREAMRKLRSTLLDKGATHHSDEPQNGPAPGSPTDPVALQRGAPGGRHRPVGGVADVAEQFEPGVEEAGEVGEIDLRVAVIGHKGCGKSTFVRRALKSWGVQERAEGSALAGLANASYASHIQPGGKVRYPWTVEFLELDMLRLAEHPAASSSTADRSSDRNSASRILGQVSGVILCYDAQREETFKGIPELLEMVTRKNLPTILLACKSDPGASIQVIPGSANHAAQPYNIGLIEVSMETSEGRSKMKNGVRWLVFKLEQRIRREQRSVVAGSSTEAVASDRPARRHQELRTKAYNSSDATLSTDDLLQYRTNGLAFTPKELPQLQTTQLPPNGEDPDLDWMMKGPLSAHLSKPNSPISPASPGTRLRPLSIQPEDNNLQRDTEDTANSPTTSPRNSRLSGIQAEAGQTSGDWSHLVNKSPVVLDQPLYLSLEELLTRLFANIVSAEDPAFVAAFFMTYRRFLSPTDLMRDFLERLRDIDLYSISKDIKFWALSKLTGALIDWSSTYPVDLAEESTQALFRECLALILRYQVVAHLVQDLIDIEEKLYDITDLDQSWSLRPSCSSSAGDEPIPITPASGLIIDNDAVLEYASSGTPVSENMRRGESASSHSFSTSSLPLDESSGAPSGSSRIGSDPKFGVMGIPEELSPTLGSGNGDAGFARWNQAFSYIVNSQAERFAMELTRMQWEIFRVIRARDVLRHDIGKERETPISASIKFFNHLSRFVSTLILANPKPKHRARVYEKFMAIAHQLRVYRNYDALCAVLAGMQEISILRMSTTMSLLASSEFALRDWKSDKLLMDPRGGYAPYRSAIKADIDHGRSAIPLLTATLGMISRLNGVRAADIREDGAVQWDKFSKFGEYLSIIPDFQRLGPPVPGEVSSIFRSIMDETPVITNEDGLYERSKFLEPGGQVVGGRTMLRKLKIT